LTGKSNVENNDFTLFDGQVYFLTKNDLKKKEAQLFVATASKNIMNHSILCTL